MLIIKLEKLQVFGYFRGNCHQLENKDKEKISKKYL